MDEVQVGALATTELGQVARAGDRPAIILAPAEADLAGLLTVIGFRVVEDRRQDGSGLVPRREVWTTSQREAARDALRTLTRAELVLRNAEAFP